MMKMKTTLTALLIMEILGLSSALIKQHYFVNQQKDWLAAYMHCKTYYHDLSTFINESEEQQFLEDAVDQTSDAWVGLVRWSGLWKWVGGENATQLNWDTNEGQTKNADCVFLHKDKKKLHDTPCTDKNPFFCMNLSEFVLVRQNMSWEGALEYCRKHYSDLGSLSSEFRMNSALGNVKQTQTQYVWTALRFLAGEWLWVTGDDLDYTAWPQTGQPQCPDTNLRCGALDNKTSVWANRDCEEELNFFCAVKADVSASSATTTASKTTENDS